jgi:pimeloyl-ACP methyl ester carboxylesterase
MRPVTDTVLSADGVPIRFDVDGAGEPPLVFVHGWSCDRTYWRHQAHYFAARHCVVAVDLAGHGDSGTDRRSWTMPAFGGDVAAVVERLDLTGAVLVGHSMGGDVIVEAAMRVRDRVRGLVWVDVYRSLAARRSAEEVERTIAPFRNDFARTTEAFVRRMFPADADPAIVAWVAADMAAAPPAIALDAMLHSVTNAGPVAAGLLALGLPAVAINPDDRPTDVKGLAAHGLRHVAMPGVGHFPMLEAPDAFNAVLADAVAALGSPHAA